MTDYVARSLSSGCTGCGAGQPEAAADCSGWCLFVCEHYIHKPKANNSEQQEIINSLGLKGLRLGFKVRRSEFEARRCRLRIRGQIAPAVLSEEHKTSTRNKIEQTRPESASRTH